MKGREEKAEEKVIVKGLIEGVRGEEMEIEEEGEREEKKEKVRKKGKRLVQKKDQEGLR